MCDCYRAKCEGCKCYMSIHMSDWCTQQKNVRPYCHRCSRKLLKQKVVTEFCVSSDAAAIVFWDNIRSTRQVEGTTEKHIGQQVIILCDDSRAYGICLN